MGSLLGKLHSLLVSPEDELPEPLKPQKEKLELLKQDLEVINIYLLNLSAVEAPKTLAKIWQQEVSDLSYDSEDFIDKTMHPNSNTNEESWSEEELSALVEQAYDTRNRHNRYYLAPQASDPRFTVVQEVPVAAPSKEAMDLVGISDSSTELIRRLNNDAEQQLKVVPILGPAGVGKTTLAKEVYRQISGQFECRICVRASRMPDTRRLLQSMIPWHQRPPCGLLVQELIDNLSERLKHKRYFIVINGLWKTRTWHIVKSAFPEGYNCSRILITTDQVTEFAVVRVLNLELWGDQEELDLSGISQLFQLRYVQITTDMVVKLPTKMNGLKYLETREIYGREASIPSDIVHLPGLLHICVPGQINLSNGIGHMRFVRTLQSFDISCNSEDNVRSLSEMTNLHDLHVTCSTTSSDLRSENLKALASSLGKHGKLKSLVLTPGASCTSVYLDCSSSVYSPPVSLQRLELYPPICIFSRLPAWIGLLQKLCILKIVVKELTNYDVDGIAGLQELTVLSLYVRQPCPERIVFKQAAFSALKYFKFRCSVLRLAFQAETMPNVRRLKLEFNVHSGEQPDDMLSGIQHLLNLQEIDGRVN
ncbi:unnamed protein product [Urochloa decumbens]|uniref:NB-ARC domain-containing protein n=1 Tax=Urochloa decumbens TaxID=240449 RepID=A0ABC9ASS6_9POAL